MRPSTLLFIGAVAISAGFAIVAAAQGDRPGFTLFKPLTTLIILLGAAWLLRPGGQPYRGLVVLALALSLAGDLLLALPTDRLLAGLAAFLLAHLTYVAAFSVGSPFAAPQLPWLAPWLLVGGGVTAYAWSGLGKRKLPVLCYVTAICAMGWRAAMRGEAAAVPRASFLLALLGACLFLASDAILAIRRFRRPFPAAHELELAAYWAAQLLIALSVRG
jgi:uncharacterized membrane protein YhhN